MKLVKYQGIHPECLEGFPEDCDRSKESALHLRPGRTMLLTDDEYAFIKAQRPDVCENCVVLRENVKKPESAESSAEPVEKSEELVEKADSSEDSDMGDEGDSDEEY